MPDLATIAARYVSASLNESCSAHVHHGHVNVLIVMCQSLDVLLYTVNNVARGVVVGDDGVHVVCVADNTGSRCECIEGCDAKIIEILATLMDEFVKNPTTSQT